MAPSKRDRISIDLRGLRATLFARARERDVTPSDLVRGLLNEALGTAARQPTAEPAPWPSSHSSGRVRVSIRLSREQAQRLASAAKAASLPTGDYITGLAAGVPALSKGGHRADHLAALLASNAELSTLSRNIRHLTTLLRQAEVRAAQEYRAMLDTLADDVRAHLKLAAAALAELRPRAGSRATTDHLEP